MSQDIADMPGIDAAMEHFSAIAGNTSADAGGSATGEQPIAKTDTTATGTPATRETNQADAQPTAEKQTSRSALPNGEAQNSVNSNPTSGFAKAMPDGARAAADFNNPQSTGGSGGSTTRNGQQSPRSKTTDDSGPRTQDSDKNGGRTASGAATASRYARAQERLEKTWETVNKRKGELDAQAQQVEQQRLSLERDRAQFEAVRQQAAQPSATPEQAMQAAQLRRRDADALRMQANRAQEGGRFEEAQRLNKQADKAESLAEDLGEYAEQLRKNPPVSMQQRAQQIEQARKQWTLEACNAFPELDKNGSRLQQVVAQHLSALSKQDPQLLVQPSLIYHVARLADAQIAAADLKPVAARVPVLEKEAESLRARIKELEASVTPAGDGGVNRLGAQPVDDYTSLRQSAVEIGHGRW